MKLSNEIRFLYRGFKISGDFLDFYQEHQIGVTVVKKNLSRFLASICIQMDAKFLNPDLQEFSRGIAAESLTDAEILTRIK